MSKAKTGLFVSFEEFEREYMPERHASKQITSGWSPEDLAAEMAAASLKDVAEALASHSKR